MDQQVVVAHLPGTCNMQADRLYHYLTNKCNSRSSRAYGGPGDGLVCVEPVDSTVPFLHVGNQTQSFGQQTHSVRTGHSIRAK